MRCVLPRLVELSRKSLTAALASALPFAIVAPGYATEAVDNRPETLTIVLGGDLGLGASGEPVHPEGAMRHGVRYRWPAMTSGLAPHINGDVNFANLETVIADRNDLSPSDRSFNFRSHPAGIRHLVSLGFNALSTANNHALDYGEAGVRSTIAHVEALAADGLAAAPGVGLGREHASRPAVVKAKGAKVTISAIGIGGRGMADAASIAAPRRAGMLAYHSAADFNHTVSRLAAAEGDVKILSVHYGSELQVRPAATDVAKLRDLAVSAHGIEIVAGHHAHVAAGVEMIGGRVVFYGLGNLLHPGMQDMSRLGICRDFGLLARLHLMRAERGEGARQMYRVAAIEAIPLTDMHVKAEPMSEDKARLRLDVLNHLSSELGDPKTGSIGVQFTAQTDGRGLYCSPDAMGSVGPIGELCRDWQPAVRPTAAVAAQVSSACRGTPSNGRDRGADPRVAISSRRGRTSETSFFDGGDPISKLFQGW